MNEVNYIQAVSYYYDRLESDWQKALERESEEIQRCYYCSSSAGGRDALGHDICQECAPYENELNNL